MSDHFAVVDATSGSPCAHALEEHRRIILDFDTGATATSDSDR